MILHNKKGAMAGFLICIFTGLLVLALGLFYSKVDLPEIIGENLTKFNEEWTVSVENSFNEKTTLPVILDEAKLGDTLVIKKMLPKTIKNDTYLFFRASHQKVKAYIDKEEVYSFGWDEERLFSKSPACAWILVPVLKDQAGEEIQIELTGVYPSYAGRINEFYMGDKSSVLTYIVKNRLGSILISMVLTILGFSMMLVAFALRKGKATKSLLRLGVFSVLVGIWSAFTVNILQVLFGDVFTLLNIEFFTFLLLLPTSLWFLDSFDYYKDRKVLHIMFWCSIALSIGIQLLQLFNKFDYMETIIAEHILMLIAIIYLIFDGMKAHFKRNNFMEARILIISVILVVIFTGLDIVKFYFSYSIDDGFFTKIGMLLFIVIWALEIIKNMSRMIVNITKTQLLEILAYQDQMTGLKNRSAFEEKLQEYRETDAQEAYIIVFDINDLKIINDNCGHSIGDQMIKEIAIILKKEFKDKGTGYRIGGDEFCVIIPNAVMIEEEYVVSKIELVKKAIHDFGEDQNLNLSLASGFSKTTGKENCDIDNAYRLADKRMYADKQKSKAV